MSYLNHLRVLDPFDESLDDRRIAKFVNTNTPIPFTSYATLADWEARRKKLRIRLLVSAGLYPYPERCPLDAKIFGRLTFDGYTVDRVIFTSRPGLHVTGNLYLPTCAGKVPMVLCPHGHNMLGKNRDDDIISVPQRCASLARLGMAAFSYDMMGYGDSVELAHRYSGMKNDLWLEQLFGVQLWNSIRALDFVETLPEVDASRIGCTGESGGGTQTYALTAVDERVKASMPVNMVSNVFGGGCYCENAPLMRIGTHNGEFTALAAPRALCLVGCTQDWTVRLREEIYPGIREIYELYGAWDKVFWFYDDAPHNYNARAVAAACRFFGRELLGIDVPLDYKVATRDIYGNADALRVLTPEDDRGVRKIDEHAFFEAGVRERLGRPVTDEQYRAAMDIVTGVEPCTPEVSHESTETYDGVTVRTGLLNVAYNGAQFPFAVVNPAGKRCVLLLHPDGKRAALASSETASYLAQGYAVAAGDLFLTGEYHTPFAHAGRDFTKTTHKGPWGERTHFTVYNYTDAAYRVQDAAALCAYLQGQYDLTVIGLSDCAPIAAALKTYTDAEVRYDLTDFTTTEDYIERCFIPGLLAYNPQWVKDIG